MKALAATALVIGMASAAAQEPDALACPELPAGSGFAWEFQLGPDFFVCRARPTDGGRQSFGVYQGFAPNFHPENGERRESGIVGGHDVTWYAITRDDTGFNLAQETMFDLEPLPDGAAPKAHVWAYADTEEQLAQMLGVLKIVKFNNRF